MACPPLSSHQYLRLPLLHHPLQWPVQGPACASALPIPVPRWPSVLAAPLVTPCSHIPHYAVLSHSSTSLPHVQALPHLTLLRPAHTPRLWGLGDVLGNLCPRADCVACGCTVQQPPAASCLPASWALSPAPGSCRPIILVLPPFCPHPPASPTRNSCTATWLNVGATPGTNCPSGCGDLIPLSLKTTCNLPSRLLHLLVALPPLPRRTGMKFVFALVLVSDSLVSETRLLPGRRDVAQGLG